MAPATRHQPVTKWRLTGASARRTLGRTGYTFRTTSENSFALCGIEPVAWGIGRRNVYEEGSHQGMKTGQMLSFRNGTAVVVAALAAVVCALWPAATPFAVAALLVPVVALLGSFRIQERSLRRAEERRAAAERERSQLAAVVEAASDIVCTVSPEGHVLFMNRAARALWAPAAPAPSDRPRAAACIPGWDRFAAIAARDAAWSGETELETGISGALPVSLAVIAHRNPAGAIDFFSAIARDISDRKRFEEQLVHLAHHDALTGLLNRRRFDERLESHLSSARRAGARGALLFVDLDGFKGINDTLGHQVGDRLLAGIASRIRATVGAHTDIVARLGGDEFAVLAPGVDREAARRLARSVVDAIATYRLSVLDESVGLTASVGVALYPEDGATSLELVAHADFAMYDAKEQKATFTEFAAQATDPDVLEGWRTRLARALADDHFVVHVQEIRQTERDETIHELLLRLSDDDGSLIPPGVFLPVAEQIGLSAQIDRWVVIEAFALAARCRADGQSTRLAINLSAASIADPGLLEWIEGETAAHTIDPSGIIFEIAEPAILADPVWAASVVRRLRAHGFRITIDDFGGGFAGPGYLKEIAADFVKIDGSLIRDLTTNALARQHVQVLVGAARAHGTRTIAEHVGDQATLRLVRTYGVEFVQGYYIAEPLALWQIFGRSASGGRSPLPFLLPETIAS